MQRRTFDHVYIEICLALDCRVSRYGLWLVIWEQGGDPDALSREQVRRFVDGGLDAFLDGQAAGGGLGARARRRLARRLLRFDGRFPAPEEWLERRPEGAATRDWPASRRHSSP